ncbi:hypothetical protein FA13DRAFT_1714000 [Coprinellus micaceus]|uniref:Uncharacterized protein n=1 Tax=Coprinellus micaceus TaxID=71717 RepID=A0A4Y7SUP3_COPMI|nr:hypothetical protein FA13DRAFT_1714000 [Coprinellus micaceus]
MAPTKLGKWFCNWTNAGVAEVRLQPPQQVVAIDTSADSDEIQAAEKDIENALDNLEATGALQSANRMSVEALLNPSVMEARDASENMDINGGDHDDPVDLPPTRRDIRGFFGSRFSQALWSRGCRAGNAWQGHGYLDQSLPGVERTASSRQLFAALTHSYRPMPVLCRYII